MTTTVLSEPQVRLSPKHLGIIKGAENPAESLEVCNELLKKNHDEFHIFWRDLGGHNHIAHALLTILALGASPWELRQSFDDNTSYQRPPPEINEDVVNDLYDSDKFYFTIGSQDDYTNFLVFFKREFEKKGWKAVVNEYVFSGSRIADAVLGHMYEGAYHPLIHLGLGVEFDQPIIIAEALAQAASHRSATITDFFLHAETEANKRITPDESKSFYELIGETRANEKLHSAPLWSDTINKLRDGILGRAGSEMINIASQFRIAPDTLERRTAEMISNCAYIAGAAQRTGKARKIDFFAMHSVTSSIFLTVLTKQDWISLEAKVRLVEWKVRLDLAWYASCGGAELRIEDVDNHKGEHSGDMDWSELFKASTAMKDDGHVPKFIRALKNGQDSAKPYEEGKYADMFPIKGDQWLKVARMAYDTTITTPQDKKWGSFAGFDQCWDMVPDA